MADNGPVDSLPLVDLAPLQPPDAVQAVALVVDHVNVAALLVVMLCGEAVSVTVGTAAEVTVTIAFCRADIPPLPLHCSE